MKKNIICITLTISLFILNAQENVVVENIVVDDFVEQVSNDNILIDENPENLFDEIKDEVDVEAMEVQDEPSVDSVDPIIEYYNSSLTKESDEPTKYKYTKEKVFPSASRPKKSSSKVVVDRSENYVKESKDILKYGLEGQISTLIDELSKNEDGRFVDEIYDLFFETKSSVVQEKILDYFTKLKDPCLASYAVEVINSPYDTKKTIVEKCFKYVSEAKITEANPGLVDLVDKEEDDYFTGALSALGEIGETEEAMFLADYLNRDDLTVAQRQALMRVLGRIKAIETWEQIAEIAQDEDENSFVRMYAAEAIGAMEKSESEDILANLFEEDDPNLRTYVVKGISHFNDKKAQQIIIQALRDSQYKVRLEAVNAVEKNKITEAVPYLIFRCKDKDEQKNVKEKCYSVIANLNDSEGNEYLISLIKDKKVGDTTKAKVAAALLEFNHAGTKEIIELARATLKNDIQKNLRYALGKEFAKYDRSEFAEICSEYIAHSDVATQGTGLDMWAKGRYSSVRAAVEEIAKDAEDEESDTTTENKKVYQFGVKKKNANAKKAKRILDMS